VGRDLVSCCLQHGHGLVITYVIVLAPSSAKPTFSHRARHVPNLLTVLDDSTRRESDHGLCGLRSTDRLLVLLELTGKIDERMGWWHF
jgi:hypothetical protein